MISGDRVGGGEEMAGDGAVAAPSLKPSPLMAVREMNSLVLEGEKRVSDLVKVGPEEWNMDRGAWASRDLGRPLFHSRV